MAKYIKVVSIFLTGKQCTTLHSSNDLLYCPKVYRQTLRDEICIMTFNLWIITHFFKNMSQIICFIKNKAYYKVDGIELGLYSLK